MLYIISGIVGLLIGAIVAYILSNSRLNKKVQIRLEEAENQAEAIKRDKLLVRLILFRYWLLVALYNDTVLFC